MEQGFDMKQVLTEKRKNNYDNTEKKDIFFLLLWRVACGLSAAWSGFFFSLSAAARYMFCEAARGGRGGTWIQMGNR